MTTYETTMTFAELITEVTTGTSRFTNSAANQAARWIQYVYGMVWTAEDWSFRHGTAANLTTVSGTQTLGNLPTDVATISGIWSDTGQRMQYLAIGDFFDLYSAGTVQGQPFHYTIIQGGTVYLGPTPAAASSTYRMTYEKRPTQLTNDTDVPSIPSEYHYMLVPGALAVGLALYNDFTFDFMQTTFQQGMDAMRRDYLNDTYGEIIQSGAFRPEPWRNAQTQW